MPHSTNDETPQARPPGQDTSAGTAPQIPSVPLIKRSTPENRGKAARRPKRSPPNHK